MKRIVVALGTLLLATGAVVAPAVLADELVDEAAGDPDEVPDELPVDEYLGA